MQPDSRQLFLTPIWNSSAAGSRPWEPAVQICTTGLPCFFLGWQLVAPPLLWILVSSNREMHTWGVGACSNAFSGSTPVSMCSWHWSHCFPDGNQAVAGMWEHENWSLRVGLGNDRIRTPVWAVFQMLEAVFLQFICNIGCRKIHSSLMEPLLLCHWSFSITERTVQFNLSIFTNIASFWSSSRHMRNNCLCSSL